MPSYTARNDALFDEFVVSDAWELPQLTALTSALVGLPFFVQDERIKGLAALRTFATNSEIGGKYVNGDLQFPADKVLYSAYNTELTDTIAALEATLSWRDTNVAKDTQVHKAVGSSKGTTDETGTNDQKGFLGQSAQDSLKRFEVQINKLYAIRKAGYWNRRKFEREMSATWG